MLALQLSSVWVVADLLMYQFLVSWYILARDKKLYNQQHQESLVALSQNMSKLCERFAYQSQTITSSGDNDSEIEGAFSSEIQRRFPFIPVAKFRSSLQVQFEEAVPAVQATMASPQGKETQEKNEQQGPSVDHSIDVGDIVPSRRRRHRVTYPSQTIIRTPLGEIRCSFQAFVPFAPCIQKLMEWVLPRTKNLKERQASSSFPRGGLSSLV